MSPVRAVLFDADGVLNTPPHFFSHRYAREHGIPIERLDDFFRTDFVEALCGRADLRDLVRAAPVFSDAPDTLLPQWFAGDHVPNRELLELVDSIRASGMPVYVATNQERHRARFMREVMFPDRFDGFFISSDLGFTKSQNEYWQKVLEQLPDLKPSEIMYFDDSPSHIIPAVLAGIQARLYESPAQVVAALALDKPVTKR